MTVAYLEPRKEGQTISLSCYHVDATTKLRQKGPQPNGPSKYPTAQGEFTYLAMSKANNSILNPLLAPACKT